MGKDSEYKPIDIKQVFREKNPAMAPYIPGFVYAYLRRILHLDFVNYFLEKHGKKKGISFLQAVIDEFNVKLEVNGEENLPEKGRFIFVSNHPLGGFDGILLLSLLGKRYPIVKSLSNDILMNIRNLEEFFIPVNKHGVQSVITANNINEAFSSDCQMLYFPAGLVSRRRRGVIRDLDWKKSFITKAVMHRRDVVPIHVSGRGTGFFYNFANFRRFLGIKYNLEMFFLPDETFRHINEHVVITIGKPVPWQTFDKYNSAWQWASKMQDFVYTLPRNHSRSFSSYINDVGNA